MKMKIAVIIPRITPLGPVKVMENLVNTLTGFPDLNIEVFYLDKTCDNGVDFRVPVTRLNTKLFRFEKYDIVHTNGIRPDFFAFLHRKKIHCHISTIHNFVFEDLKFTYNRLISLLFGHIWLNIWHRADKLVCVSETMKEYYKKWFSLSKLESIHNGVSEYVESSGPDADVVKAVEEFKSRGLKIIGTASAINRRKGVDQILKLISAECNYAFVIIGDGKELPELKHLVVKLNISDRILFCGYRSNAASYFRLFDFFIMPSRSEGFGLALVEAVQQKVPVICSDIEVFKELFTKEEVTFFKLEDIKSLVKALKESTDYGIGKVISANARYRKYYTNQNMAVSYYRLYQSA